jgi:GntR family transcriptional regulator
MSKIPAYAKTYETIKKEILDGEYSVGDFLPPEPELEIRFGVSRTTIRRAVDLLNRDGLVRAMQGRGTEVLDYKTKQNLNLVTSISETLRRKGFEVVSKNMHIDAVEATPSLAKNFAINVGDPLVRIQRIQLADGMPVAIMRNFLLPDMVSNIAQYENKFTSLYQFLEEIYSINIDSATDSIISKCADFGEATMLNVSVGSAILYIRRVCFSKGKPVCAGRLSVVGEKYEFDVNMIGRFKDV